MLCLSSRRQKCLRHRWIGATMLFVCVCEQMTDTCGRNSVNFCQMIAQMHARVAARSTDGMITLQQMHTRSWAEIQIEMYSSMQTQTEAQIQDETLSTQHVPRILSKDREETRPATAWSRGSEPLDQTPQYSSPHPCASLIMLCFYTCTSFGRPTPWCEGCNDFTGYRCQANHFRLCDSPPWCSQRIRLSRRSSQGVFQGSIALHTDAWHCLKKIVGNCR